MAHPVDWGGCFSSQEANGWAGPGLTLASPWTGCRVQTPVLDRVLLLLPPACWLHYMPLVWVLGASDGASARDPGSGGGSVVLGSGAALQCC